MAIVDCEVCTGRPINHVSNFVSPRPWPAFRNLPRKIAGFFSVEQIVHSQSQREQRNEILCRFAVDQTSRKYLISHLQAYLHGAYLLRRRRGSIGRASLGRTNNSAEGQRQRKCQDGRSGCHAVGFRPEPIPNAQVLLAILLVSDLFHPVDVLAV